MRLQYEFEVGPIWPLFRVLIGEAAESPGSIVLASKSTDVAFQETRGPQGQRNMPVTDVRGIVEVVMLLPGRMAARVRS